jgi:hypothetical protein
MKKLLIPALFVFLLACDDDDAPSKTELLTNNSSKAWYVTAETDADEECGHDSDMGKDNTWTFHSDGKFNYDHGSVTAGEGCIDLKNFTGTWVFEENETYIRIHAAYNTDDPQDLIDEELVYAKIIELTGDRMVLEAFDSQATFSPR